VAPSQALNTWNSMLLEKTARAPLTSAPASASEEGVEAERPQVEAGADEIDEVQLLYFFLSLGGVYESAGLDELALACYT